MKPMGLTDPRTGRRPYAVVQLRQENLRADSFNLVGFQNHLKFGEQARILRLIPGLENAEFLRFGQIHRNTYINAPALLDAHAATAHAAGGFLRRADFRRGRLRGIHRHRPDGGHARRRAGHRRASRAPLPRETALGSLCHYISGADPADYQPANITFDLLPPLDEATAPAAAPRQAGAPRRGLPARAGGAGGVPARPCLSSSWTRRSSATWQELARTGASPHTLARLRRRPAPVSGVPLAARDRRRPSRAPSTC